MNVLVFGGSGRIGSAICHVFIEDEKDRFDVYNLDISDSKNTSASYVKCDVTNMYSIRDCMERTPGNIDIIINAAYPRPPMYGKRFPFPYAEDIQSFLTGNLVVPYSILSEGYVRGCRNMVFLSSIYGSKTPEFWMYDDTEIPPTPIEYVMSKSALNHMVHYYAKQLPDLNINCIAPGGIKSGMDDKFIRNYEKIGPFTDSYDVAKTAKWLVEQSGITGQVITVDNGWSL